VQRRVRRACWAAVVAGLAACTPHPVGPARTDDAYEGKAVTTAEAARSAVASVRLATVAAGRGSFGPYLSVLVSDQEEELSGVQGTFASVQPPSERSDDLRRELDDLLSAALDHVVDVRVATRRGRLDDLASIGAPLDGDAAALEAFVEAHGG
jgi:hypothetical protein